MPTPPSTSGGDELESKVPSRPLINRLFAQMSRDEATRGDYIRMLGAAMVGIPIEKNIIANGGGGNGEGVIHELMEVTLGGSGGYYYTPVHGA